MKPVIALTKGRVEKQFLAYLEERAIDSTPLVEKGRKLSVETDQAIYFFAKGVDVTTYVEHGIADLGVVGEDIIAEFQPDVFNLFPLPFGACKMAVAAEEEKVWPDRKKRIASKYTNITKQFYLDKGESVDIIKLEGSVELAPLLGLADAIVDIVETGTTLKENGLEVIEDIQYFTARVIANRSSLKMKRDILQPYLTILQEEVSTS
ncbi:ATP phosphoribosyltransferase [Terribacillus halophilus]|uniref:ATP phosphoribosyltransferase n=1 Tax=Terribacillus halophilus TaxID=361279 RepID=UPI0009862DB8|nr:ATP phosphoribosyltransferase [Terribacillus halophilus]